MTSSVTGGAPKRAVIPHIGVRVADLDRSLAFYTEALDFALSGERYRVSAPDLLGEGNDDVEVQFVEHPDGTRIELFRVEGVPAEEPDPGVVFGPETGISHMIFFVDDFDEAWARILRFGGRTLLPDPAVRDDRRIQFCADPDGIRIELVERLNN